MADYMKNKKIHKEMTELTVCARATILTRAERLRVEAASLMLHHLNPGAGPSPRSLSAYLDTHGELCVYMYMHTCIHTCIYISHRYTFK